MDFPAFDCKTEDIEWTTFAGITSTPIQPSSPNITHLDELAVFGDVSFFEFSEGYSLQASLFEEWTAIVEQKPVITNNSTPELPPAFVSILRALVVELKSKSTCTQSGDEWIKSWLLSHQHLFLELPPNFDRLQQMIKFISLVARQVILQKNVLHRSRLAMQRLSTFKLTPPTPLVSSEPAETDSKTQSHSTPPPQDVASKLSIAQQQCQRRLKHPKSKTTILETWFREHEDNPYPDDHTKSMLAQLADLSVVQLNHWFTNARKRKWSKKRKASSDIDNLSFHSFQHRNKD